MRRSIGRSKRPLATQRSPEGTANRATERKADSGRVVTPNDEADARLLTGDVDRLALALEPSGAFIRTRQTTIAKFRRKWHEFDLKVRDLRDARRTKYPHSLLTTWQTTFEQLTAAAVDLLRVCRVVALLGDTAAAHAALAEAQQIAEHGPMPLFLADVHLHRARLFRDKSELTKAAKLIRTFGYGRRYDELADAEEAAKNW